MRGVIGGCRGGSRAGALKATPVQARVRGRPLTLTHTAMIWGEQWQGAECRPLWTPWLVALPLAVARGRACGVRCGVRCGATRRGAVCGAVWGGVGGCVGRCVGVCGGARACTGLCVSEASPRQRTS